MTKNEFLTILKADLADVSPEERVAAVQYYTEYFDEAGPEHEAEVLEELGDPKKIAQDIIAASGAMATTGWTPPPPRGERAPAGDSQSAAPAPEVLPEPVAVQDTQWQGGPSYNNRNNRVAKIILIVLLLIVLIPLLSGMGGVMIGVLAALVCVFLCPIIIGVAFGAAGISCIISGGILAAQAVAPGLLVIGVGVLLFGLAGLLFYAGIRLLGKTIPAIVRGIIGMFRAIFTKIRGMAA